MIDSLLPGVAPLERLDLALTVTPEAPGWALCGLVDWLGALALGSASLARLPVGGDGPAALALRVHHDITSDGAELTESGLAYSDPVALLRLTEILGHPAAAWRAGIRSVAWRVGALEVDGVVVTLSRPVSLPSGPLLALLPGQARDQLPPPVALPEAAPVEWVLAAADFAARWAVSATVPLPWPFLRAAPPAAGGRVGLRPDGLIHVPAGSAGTGIWRALARLTTYPERPLRFRQHRVPAPDLPAVYETQTEVAWEGDRLLELAAREVLPRLPAAAAVEVFASEPAPARAELALPAAGAPRRGRPGAVGLQAGLPSRRGGPAAAAAVS